MCVYLTNINVLSATYGRPHFLGPRLIDITIHNDMQMGQSGGLLELKNRNERGGHVVAPMQINAQFGPAVSNVPYRSKLDL